jgi:hypothetical protein
MIDKILDKISQLGIKSLSKKERELLEAHSKGEPTLEIINELKYRQDRKDSLFSYDPRRDEEFFNELGFDFTEYDDDDLEEGKYWILWDEVSDEEIMDFKEYFDIPVDGILLDGKIIMAWSNLSDDVKIKFKEYINNIY